MWMPVLALTFIGCVTLSKLLSPSELQRLKMGANAVFSSCSICAMPRRYSISGICDNGKMAHLLSFPPSEMRLSNIEAVNQEKKFRGNILSNHKAPWLEISSFFMPCHLSAVSDSGLARFSPPFRICYNKKCGTRDPTVANAWEIQLARRFFFRKDLVSHHLSLIS